MNNSIVINDVNYYMYKVYIDVLDDTHDWSHISTE